MAGQVRIPLASAIEALRGELAEAIRSGEGEELRFALGTVELELQVTVEKQVEGSAGIKFWLVSAGGGGKAGTASAQKIKLSLTATRTTPDGIQSPVLVGSKQSKRPK